MNKIIVVGHPQSGLEKVEELLLVCGMSQALPSRREGFTPAQISETLIKAHGAVPVQQVCSADELTQIAVAPVWQGLAMDLMLANMEQSFWGWTDIQAIYLLDYWKDQDPQTMFVLVYESPQSALTQHAIEQLETDAETLRHRVNGWTAYNAALLSFHLRNPERSLLVHADQVQVSASHYVQQLSARIDAPLQLPSLPKTQPSTSATADDGVLPVPHTDAEASVTEQDNPQVGLCQGLHGNILAQLLAEQLLEEHPEATELYAQLQAAASIPLRMQRQGQVLLGADILSRLRYQAWMVFVAQQVAMQKSAVRLMLLDKTAREQELQLNCYTTVLQSCEQENALLLAQLHEVQEELERRHLQAQDHTARLTVEPKLKAAQEITAKVASNDLKKENELLLTQLHNVQEELERYYLENCQLKANGSACNFQSKKEYYGAADRVKQQLSYRLGATVIKQSRSLRGWLKMPFALRTEVNRYNKYRESIKNQNFPPISQYKDAYEAEKVKKHLSYRLGARFLSNIKTFSGWVSLPWSLYAEVKEFKKELRSR